MNCIETRGLTHRFSEEETVLSNIELNVPQGSIYGFLGPNGAGKTTTLRLILGLLKKQEGQINIFGQPFEKHRIQILSNIGSLIESPSLYSHLTATENLAILQKVYQCPKSRIAEVLKIVGLENTGRKKTGRFSLGMKQRLSIAIAILHKPQLLILDEPTNGLDPNGIIEVRELLKKLNTEQGMTVLVSSHLLAEIEKLVTHLGIINKGQLLFQGSIEALHEQQAHSASVLFHTSDVSKTTEIIQAMNIETHVHNGMIGISSTSKETIAQINARLVGQQVAVYQITTVKNDLESIFIDLTK